MTGSLSSSAIPNLARPPGVVLEEDATRPAAAYPYPVTRCRLSGANRADCWISVGFMTAAAVEAVVQWHGRPAGLILNLGGALAFGFLMLRRTHPLLMVSAISVLGVAGALISAQIAPTAPTNSSVGIIVLIVAMYSLGVYGSRRELLAGAPQPVLMILAIDVLQPQDHPLASAIAFAVLFVVVVPTVAGRLVRGRTRLVERLRGQAAELEAHREVWAEQELARERLHLSERFHEVLLSGMHALAIRVETAGSHGASAEDVSQIEQAARNLLARTREAIVALAATTVPDPEPHGVSSRAAARCSEPQPWTALAAAALGGGLLVELPALPAHVAAPIAVLACAILVLPLAFVWVAPLTMTVALWVLAAAFDAFVAPLDTSFTAIGLAFVPPFVVAALTSRPRAVLGFGVCVLGQLVCFGRSGLADSTVILLFAWVAGAVLQERSRLVERLRSTAMLLTAQREAAAGRAVLDERSRLASELHDALGHSLTVVTLQAEAARRLWHTDHERALDVLETLTAAMYDGLADLQFGFAPVSPLGGLLTADSLDRLVGVASDAALQVEADLDDVAGLLDNAGQVVVYRILQESLTNALKHAPGALVRVRVRLADAHVEISVTNTCGATNLPGAGLGRGLASMRARAVSRGGQLSWGAEPDGGFSVRAHLPTTLVPT